MVAIPASEYETEDCEVCFEKLKDPGDPPVPTAATVNLFNDGVNDVYKKYFKPGYTTFCSRGHAFHWSCITGIMRRDPTKCPVCRAPITDDRKELLKNRLDRDVNAMVHNMFDDFANGTVLANGNASTLLENGADLKEIFRLESEAWVVEESNGLDFAQMGRELGVE